MYARNKRRNINVHYIDCAFGGWKCWCSWRMNVVVTPSGMIYDEMVPDDIFGCRSARKYYRGQKASVDTGLFAFLTRCKVNAVIHAHISHMLQDWSLVPMKFPVISQRWQMQLKDRYAAYGDPGGLSMGESCWCIGNRTAVLKHHGVIAVGKDLPLAMCLHLLREKQQKLYPVCFVYR